MSIHFSNSQLPGMLTFLNKKCVRFSIIVLLYTLHSYIFELIALLILIFYAYLILALHYNFFPKSFGEILSKFDIVEMHFTMTQGRWRYNKWGYPVITAPTGIELWVWFHPDLNTTRFVFFLFFSVTVALNMLVLFQSEITKHYFKINKINKQERLYGLEAMTIH